MLSARNLSASQATLIGLIAPICWGLSVSLVRGIAEGIGLAQGQFLLYCVSTLCVLFTVRLPDFRKIDKRYLFLGIPTANLSSLSFCLAIFTSSGGAQTLDVGMVNAVVYHPLCRSFQPHRYALVTLSGVCGCLYRDHHDSK